MGKWILRIFCLYFFILSNGVFAQKAPRPEIDLDRFTQDLFGAQSGDARFDAILEAVFQYYRDPLNMNTATRGELESLYILSPLQIKNFLEHREKNGFLISEYELQTIPEWNSETIERILPFIKVQDDGLNGDTRSLWTKIKEDKNNYIIARYQRVLELQKGFKVNDTIKNQAFLGSPELIYTRYRSYQKGDYSIGITTQKDVGELVDWNPAIKQYGMDFYSGHAAIFNKGRLKALNIGDYQIMIGQGMVMSAGFYIGKGAETVTTAKRSNTGIRPYTAALETNFLRGAAATVSFGQFDITPFYSYRLLDGNIADGEGNNSVGSQRNNFGGATSIQQSGFHRTRAELEDKETIKEQIVGNYIRYSSKDQNLKIGVNGIYNYYNPTINRAVNIYNQFYFNGKDNYNFGADFSYNWQNFSFFGEYSRNKAGGNGAVAGFITSLNAIVDMALLFRSYDRDYYSAYGNSFGESSVNRNERGVYWGIKITPNRKINFAGYFDKFYFPWLTSGTDGPTDGYEYFGRLNFKPTKKILLYAQWRHQNKPTNAADNNTPTDFVAEATTDNYLINLDWKGEKLIGTKSRVQFTQYRQAGQPTESGFVIFQDLDLDFSKKVKISARFALFDANNYNTRIYVYEKNVLWAFALPVYYGQGIREYLMLQYNATRDITLWFRIARFEYRNADKISSGINEITGNSKTEVTLQLKYDF
ncbi:MAG: helix-hairpin-helix domain-containing protein [Cytophagales bacterium]